MNTINLEESIKKFNQEVLPVYVGISNNVFNRLRQDGWGYKYKLSNLTYNAARRKFRYTFGNSNFSLSEGNINKETLSLHCDIEKTQQFIKNLHVLILQIDNPKERHLFEIMLVIKFNTELNKFR